jgi:ABC-type Zn uptake system ZnuABC Zn-binding protein ZnuA
VSARLPCLLAVLVVLVAALALAACGDAGGPAPGGGPRVVATTTQVGDLARAVGGRRVQVDQILQATSDPHDFEPRPSDARAVGEAAVVLRSGGDLDEWLGDLLGNAGSGARVVTLLDAVRPRRTGDGIDPHWWQDPRNAELAVGRIAAVFAAADPAGAGVYRRNAAAYERRLRRLDRAIARCMGRIPPRERRLVTDHDAMGYFAARYGIEVIGTIIPALSTQARSSAGEVADLVRTIRRAGVRTVYPEAAGNTRLQRAVAQESDARIGPGLYADALGRPGSAGATYLGALRANARALASGFTGRKDACSPPL